MRTDLALCGYELQRSGAEFMDKSCNSVALTASIANKISPGGVYESIRHYLLAKYTSMGLENTRGSIGSHSF